MSEKIPLTYTFGNHMHWVDMEWLWGYHVLPGSVVDMLAYCRETGAKGCVNFDGIGYEKMAAEAPEALQALREAVAVGTVEPAGCSYGQPYGLFHGGESNVRQRVYGVRTVMRLLDVRPKTFWEEEFDFFPQLPQMLRGAGFTGASLYFQWTWHTPEVPFEASPVVWWEGQDGTRILTATRNRLNLHQWPEDFQILLDELAEVGPAQVLARGPGSPPPTPSSCSGHEPSPAHEEGAHRPTLSSCSGHEPSPAQEVEAPDPLVLQWLELMPSQDWMCRAEVMVPKLLELKMDDRFEVTFATLGEYLERQRSRGRPVPVRPYRMDDVWHGMTLGKNGDAHTRRSAELECRLLAAEAAWAVLGLFGRPYSPWDVYPVWELEECWRMLLAAQHHDNHECEGLCGHVAEAQMAYVDAALSSNDPFCRLEERHLDITGRFLFNRLGHPVSLGAGERHVPALGYTVIGPKEGSSGSGWSLTESEAVYESEALKVVVSLGSGKLLKLERPGHALNFDSEPWPNFEWKEDGVAHRDSGIFNPWRPTVSEEGLFLMLGDNGDIGVWYVARPEQGCLEVVVSIEPSPQDDTFRAIRFDPGYQGGVKCVWTLPFAVQDVVADSPYGVQTVEGGSQGRRKYPEGDWMTSPQWFETVQGAFTAASFVDFVDEQGGGLLVCHDGAQQWFRTENGFENVMIVRDPWDGDDFVTECRASYRLLPHGPISNTERGRHGSLLRGRPDDSRSDWPLAQRACGAPRFDSRAIPWDFSFCQVVSGNVVVTAVYRESEDYSGRDLESYAGRGMGYPYVLRLVEFDGLESEVDLNIAGPVAKAFKTNLLGEVEEEVAAERGEDALLTSEPEQLKPFGIEASRLRFKMRTYEIATLYLDVVPGRKQFRDLDAKREVWATVHR